ncbi:MAG: TadE/TadG family type IV pilus assembly protein [Thermincolia bacterium]
MKALFIKAVRFFKRLKNEEKGSIIVLVALGMVVLLSFAAMVTDVGLLYLNRTKLANAIDAATLAGIQELPQNPDKAKLVARDYASRNGADPNQLNITIAPDNQSIKVESTRAVNLVFAKAFGFSTGEVAVGAEAKVGPITAIKGAAPLSIVEQQFETNKLYVLKYGEGNGWFGPLSLGGNGASRYRDNLKTGYQGELKVGMMVDTQTGNMSGPTRDGIEYRINNCPHTPRCTVDTYHRDCSMVMYIPVIRAPSGSGQVKQVEVVGFAAFLVIEVPGSGNNSVIKGYFINTVLPGEIDFSKTGFGLSGVKLIH